MTKEDKRAILTDWLIWAIGARVQDDFMLRGSIAFVIAKLDDLKYGEFAPPAARLVGTTASQNLVSESRNGGIAGPFF